MAGNVSSVSEYRKQDKPQRIMMEVHPAEKRLLEYLRQLRYGTIEQLQVEHGLPTMIAVAREKVKLY